MPLDRPDRAKAEAAARLREVGLRTTRPRVLVYGILRELGGHRSVGEMAGHLAQRGHRISRMSVYNVIADLEAAGLVMCADTGPGRALYEAAETWHHHYVCRVCQRVWDVPCLRGEKPCLEPPVSAPGTVDEAQVIFRGTCEACASVEESKTGKSVETVQTTKEFDS